LENSIKTTTNETRRCTLEATVARGLIEDLADDFLKFFFTNAEEILDFNRKISFLDKELEQFFQVAKMISVAAVVLNSKFLGD
jgi:hypothetical protein